MEDLRQRRSEGTRYQQLVDLAPFLLLFLIVFIKLISFNVMLDSRLGVERDSSIQWLLANRYVVSSTLAFLFVVAAPLLFVTHKWRFVFLLAGNTLLTTVILGNILYFRFYWNVVSISSHLSATMFPFVWLRSETEAS